MDKKLISRLTLYLFMLLSLGLYNLFVHGFASSDEHYGLWEASPQLGDDEDMPNTPESSDHEDDFIPRSFPSKNTSNALNQQTIAGQSPVLSPFISPLLPPPKAA